MGTLSKIQSLLSNQNKQQTQETCRLHIHLIHLFVNANENIIVCYYIVYLALRFHLDIEILSLVKCSVNINWIIDL